MLPAASNAASPGPQKAAALAGPPSPCFSPPPATVVIAPMATTAADVFFAGVRCEGPSPPPQATSAPQAPTMRPPNALLDDDDVVLSHLRNMGPTSSCDRRFDPRHGNEPGRRKLSGRPRAASSAVRRPNCDSTP